MPEKRKIRPATLQNALKHREDRHAAGKAFPEDLPGKVSKAVESSDMMQMKLRDAGKMTPEERAHTGGLAGAFLGNKVAGAHGALIGAAIGSDAVRGLGVAQSGEQDSASRQAEVFDTFAKLKIINQKGEISFKDGGSIDVSDTESPVLNNVAPNIKGKEKRNLFEYDDTNPYSKKTAKVALPLAYYVVGGLLKHEDFKDQSTLQTIDHVATLLTNAFQVQANSLEAINARAQEITKKIGVKRSQMESFFYAQREGISAKDAEKIKQGIDLLYRK